MKKKIDLKLVAFSLLLSFFCMNAWAADYYWVNGGGTWNDLAHWSPVSGGLDAFGIQIKYEQLPNSDDNVFFDGKSGFGTSTSSRTISIPSGAMCKDITFQGIAASNAPVLNLAGGYENSTNSDFEVYGSLTFLPGMSISGPYLSTMAFRSESGDLNKITTSGVSFNGMHLQFSGAGTWQLQDNFNKGNSTFRGMVLNGGGTLDFNGKNLNNANYFSVSSGSNVNIANSTITLEEGWTYGGVPLTADKTANSNIIIKGSMSANPTDVYHNLEFAGNGSTINGGTYNKITYTGSGGTISNAIQADSLLILSPGLYTFNGTVTINKLLSAEMLNCGTLIELTGKNATSTDIIVSAATKVTVRDTRLRNMKITGPLEPYPATSSIDMGGNAGWNITESSISRTYYWVGGTGNWNDLTHWAKSSGGTGGVDVCIPTPFDNVIFDEGSSFTSSSRTVKVDQKAYCDSMTWETTTVKPIFDVAAQLEINGSLYFQKGMTRQGGSTIMMTSNRPNEEIITNGVYFRGPLTFQSYNGNGEWYVRDTLRVRVRDDLDLENLGNSGSTLTFRSGHLHLGPYSCMYMFNSIGDAYPFDPNRTLDISEATIEVRGSMYEGAIGWRYTGGQTLTYAQSAGSTII